MGCSSLDVLGLLQLELDFLGCKVLPSLRLEALREEPPGAERGWQHCRGSWAKVKDGEVGRPWGGWQPGLRPPVVVLGTQEASQVGSQAA